MPRASLERPRPSRVLLWAAVVVGAFVAVFAVATVTARWAATQASAAASASASASPEPEPSSATLDELYATVAPSVVTIAADDAVGAGVVVNEDGSILTALHVIENASTITVTYYDGTTTSAALTQSDAATDTATLIPDALPEVLVPATVGGTVDIGDEVIAIGTPLGLEWSASAGIVSGLDRTLDDTDATASGLIQFDAAVNPGSAGGPLVDAEGHVAGIVVALLTPDGDEGFSGIGLAVPVGTALAGDGGAGDGGPQQ